MILWTDATAAAATGGTPTAPFAATGVAIDSRSLAPGDLFIALKDRRDGHDFVVDAFARGAAGAVVAHVPRGTLGPCLVVEDTFAALRALAAAGRSRTRARVVAVTGSVGKTSTKEMLRTMLSAFGPVHAAEASFNNHWGVPLTLARLAPDAAFAVVEIGMNAPGEIAPLAGLTEPHVAVITAIAPAHLERLGSLAAIATEKAALFSGLVPNGVALWPTEAPFAETLARAARAKGATPVPFGPGGRVEACLVRQTESALVLKARVGETELFVRLAEAGAHHATLALACLGVADALGLDLALAAQALGRWQPPEGRGARHKLWLDPADFGDPARAILLIDDAYNANPASMAAALATLAAQTPGARGRRVAILGDMLELGPEELALHQALAAHPAMTAIAIIHTVGPRMAALHAALPAGKRGLHAESIEALLPQVVQAIRPGDVVLVKGSKGSQVAKAAALLKELAAKAEQQAKAPNMAAQRASAPDSE